MKIKNKIKYGTVILCAFALIISSAGVYAWQTQETKSEENDKLIPTSTGSIFTAEIGEIKDETLYYLNGNWNEDEKAISCDGTVISENQQGVFTGTFTEGKKGSNFQITIIIEGETIDLKGGYKLLKNSNFQGEWCNNEKENCFDFVYPISYIMPDGTIITGDSKEEINQLIKVWYEAHPGVKEKYVLQFPVDIIYQDGTVVTINNDEELKDAYENCYDEVENCFDFVYPISYIMPDGTIITGNSKEEINILIKAWYEENPDEKEKPALQYPVDIVYEDGTVVTINNDEDLKTAYENCDNDTEGGWITGTVQGMEDNSRLKNIRAILARFPFFARLLSRPIFQILINSS